MIRSCFRTLAVILISDLLCLCLPLFLCLCLSVGRSVGLSVSVSVGVSHCLSGCLTGCLPARLPACLPACLPVCLSVCLSVSPRIFNKAIFTVILFVRCVECRLLLLLDHLFYVDSIIMLCDRCGCMPVDREQNF